MKRDITGATVVFSGAGRASKHFLFIIYTLESNGNVVPNRQRSLQSCLQAEICSAEMIFCTNKNDALFENGFFILPFFLI